MPADYLSRAEVREIDRHAIEDLGIPGVVLMENAGRAVAAAVQDLLVGASAPNVAVLCGRGNNGGDGYVAARHLMVAGVPVAVYLLCDPADVQGDARVHLGVLTRMSACIAHAVGPADLTALARATVVVDALLGTGLAGAVREPYRGVIAFMNDLSRPTIAVDIPSGLDCDTGAPLAIAVRATRTVTFVAPKKGFANPASRHFTGDVIIAHIGAPR
jgi:hydroxyethylthiazole kinase-like uncharacterized protein yjeF